MKQKEKKRIDWTLDKPRAYGLGFGAVAGLAMIHGLIYLPKPVPIVEAIGYMIVIPAMSVITFYLTKFTVEDMMKPKKKVDIHARS